ncbi:protein-glutamine glutaminase family protein [Actinophytocola sp. KF-1]
MAMMVSPEVAKLFQVLTGEEWPDANEDQLRALAAEWAMGAQALGDQLGPGLSAAVHAIRSEWAGEAERAFAARVAPFIEGDNYIAAAAQLFKSLSDYLLKLAQDVEYMKLVSIYSLIALLAEIALAIAMSPFTGGASMAWLAARMAVVRFLLQSLLGRLLIQLLQAAVFGIAFQLLIDAAAQATQFAMGTRTQWDTDKTANAAGVGAMGAALAPFMGGLGKVLSAGLTKFLNTYFSKVFGNQWQKKLPEIITEIGTEAFHETLTEALYKYATEGEFEMNPYAATSGAASGAGSALGDGIGKFVFDVKPGPGGGSGGGSGAGQNQPPPIDTRGDPGGGPGAGNGPGNGVGNGPGPGNGSGPGFGNGPGNGSGPGFGNGPGNGSGPGFGNGPGNGFGPGFGNGSGNGFGPGNGFGNGPGDGDGSGPGNGAGPGNGFNDGPGNGFGNGPANGVGNGPGNGFGNGPATGSGNDNGPVNGPVDSNGFGSGNGSGNSTSNGPAPVPFGGQPGGNGFTQDNPRGLNNPGPGNQTPTWTDTIAGPNPPANSSPVTTPSTVPPPMDQPTTGSERPPAAQTQPSAVDGSNVPVQESPGLGQTSPEGPQPQGQNSTGSGQFDPQPGSGEMPGQGSPSPSQSHPQSGLGEVSGQHSPGGDQVGSPGQDLPGAGQSHPQPGLGGVPGQDSPGGSQVNSPGQGSPGLGQPAPQPSLGEVPGQHSPGGNQVNPSGQGSPGAGQSNPQPGLEEVPGQDSPGESQVNLPGQGSPGLGQPDPQSGQDSLGLGQPNPQPGQDSSGFGQPSGNGGTDQPAPPSREPSVGDQSNSQLLTDPSQASPKNDSSQQPRGFPLDGNGQQTNLPPAGQDSRPQAVDPLTRQPLSEQQNPSTQQPPPLVGGQQPVAGSQNNGPQPTTSTTPPTTSTPQPAPKPPRPDSPTPKTTPSTSAPKLPPVRPNTAQQAVATLGADTHTAPAETHELVTNPVHTNPPPVRTNSQGKGPESKKPEVDAPENNGEQISTQGKGPEGKQPETKGSDNNGDQNNTEGNSREGKGPEGQQSNSTIPQGNQSEGDGPESKGPESSGEQSTSAKDKGPEGRQPESKGEQNTANETPQGKRPEGDAPQGKKPEGAESKGPETKSEPSNIRSETPQGSTPEGKGPTDSAEQSNTKGETPQGNTPRGKQPEGKAPENKGPETKSPEAKSEQGSTKGEIPQGKKPEGRAPTDNGEPSNTKGETPQGKKPEGRAPTDNGEPSNTKGETPQGKKPEGRAPTDNGEPSNTKGETPQGKKPEGRAPTDNGEPSNTKDETPQGKKPEGKGPTDNGEQSNTKDETPQGKKPEGKAPTDNGEQSNTKSETPQDKKPESSDQNNNGDQNSNNTPTPADIQAATADARDRVAVALGAARAAYNQARSQLPAIARAVRDAHGAVLGTSDAVARAQQRLRDARQHRSDLRQQLINRRQRRGSTPITDVESAIAGAVRAVNTARADLAATQASHTAATRAYNDALDAQNSAVQAVTGAGNAVRTIADQLTIANNAVANNQPAAARGAENTADSNRDVAKRAVTTVADAVTAATEAAKQGGVEKAITQLSSLPPRSELTIDTLGSLNDVAGMLAGLAGVTTDSVHTQLTNLGTDGLANAINNGSLTISTPSGPVTVDLRADLHRPVDTRYTPVHTQPGTTSHDSSAENTNPLSSSTSSSMPLRIPVLFISPIDAAGGAIRPMVYVGGVAKRAQKFDSGTTSSSSTTNQQTYVPTTMSITANLPGGPQATATVDTGLRLPTITRTNVLTPNPVPAPAFTSLTPAPVTVPPSFVPHLGSSANAAQTLHDNLLTPNNNPAQVDVNGTTVTVTPTAPPTITLVGTTGVDHSHSNSHSNSWSTTRGSDATFGAGLYGGLKGWFVGGFTDFSTGATDGTNPANEHSTSHSTSDTELVYRIDRPMRVGDGDGVRDTVSSTVQVPVPLARSLGLALPPHLTGTQPVDPAGNRPTTYWFGKDAITSVNTTDVVRDLSQGLSPDGQAAVAAKFGSQNGARDAIYNAMHGGDQVTWQEGGRTHFLDIIARPVPPNTTAPSSLTDSGAEDKNADQYRRTYDSKRSARFGVGGAHLFTGTDSPNPNPPKATPEAGLPNPYQGGPTTSGGLPRAGITATWEGGYANKSGYTGKDGRASKYDGDLRDFTGDVEFITSHRSTKTPNWAQRFFFGDRQLFGPAAEHRFSGPWKSDIDHVLAGNPSGHADLNTVTVTGAIDVATASDKLGWATRPLPPSTMNPGIYLGAPPAAAPRIDAAGLGDYTNVEHVYVTPNTTEGVYIAMAKRVEPTPGTTPSATRTPPAGSGNWSTWGQQQFTESRTNPDGTPKTYTYKNSELTRPGTTSNDAIRDFVGQAGSRGTATQGIGGAPKSTGRMVQTGRLTDFNGELKAKVDYSSPRLVDIRPNGTLKRNQAGDHVTGSTKSTAIGVDGEISLGYASKRDGRIGALLRGVFGGGWKGGSSHAVDLTSGAKHAYEYKGPTAFVALDARYTYEADMNIRNVIKTKPFTPLPVTVDQPNGVVVEMPVAHAIDLFTALGMPVPPDLAGALPDAKDPIANPAQTLLTGDGYASYSDTAVVDAKVTAGTDQIGATLDALGVTSAKWRADITGQIDTMLNSPSGHVWLKDVLVGGQGHGGVISVPNSNIGLEDVVDIRVTAVESNRPHTGPPARPIVPDKQSNADYVSSSVQDKKSNAYSVAAALEVGFNSREVPSVPPGQPGADGTVQQAQPNAGASSGAFTPQVFGGSKTRKTDEVLPGSGSDKVNTQVDTDKVGRTSHEVDYRLTFSRRRVPMPVFDTPLLGVPSQFDMNRTAPAITLQGSVDLLSPGADASPPLTRPAAPPTFDVLPGRPPRPTPMFGPTGGWRVEAIGAGTAKAIHDALYAQLGNQKLPAGPVPQARIDTAANTTSSYTRPGGNAEYVAHAMTKGSSLHSGSNAIFTGDKYHTENVIGAKNTFHDTLFDYGLTADFDPNSFRFVRALPDGTEMNLSQEHETGDPQGTSTTVSTSYGPSLPFFAGATTNTGAAGPTTVGTGPPVSETIGNDVTTATSSKTGGTDGVKYTGRSYLFLANADFYSDVTRKGSNWTHSAVESVRNVFTDRPDAHTVVKIGSRDDLHVRVWEQEALDKGLITIADVWQHGGKQAPAGFTVTGDAVGGILHPVGDPAPVPAPADAPRGRTLHVAPGVSARDVRDFVATLPRDMRPAAYTVDPTSTLTPDDIHAAVDDLPDPPSATTPPDTGNSGSSSSNDSGTQPEHNNGKGPAEDPEAKGKGPADSPEGKGEGPAESPEAKGKGPADSAESEGNGPADSAEAEGERPAESPEATSKSDDPESRGKGPADSAESEGNGPADSAEAEGERPAESPEATSKSDDPESRGKGLADSAEQKGTDPAERSEAKGKEPAEKPEAKGKGPAERPESKGEEPAESPESKGKGPADRPEPRGEGPVDSTESKGKGPATGFTPDPVDVGGKGPDLSRNPQPHEGRQGAEPGGRKPQPSGSRQVRDPHDPAWEARVDDARDVLTNLPRDTQQRLFQDASTIVSGGHQTVLFVGRPTAEQIARQELLDQIRDVVMLDLHQNGPESARQTSKDLGTEFGTTRTSGLPGGAPQPAPAPVGESSGQANVDLGDFLTPRLPTPTQPHATPPPLASTTTLARANEFYDQLATATFHHPTDGPLPIPTQHPEDGCYIRAHLWAQQIREWGVDVKKVFIGRNGNDLVTQSENAFGATRGNPRPVTWRYHVAPLISIDLGNDGPPLEVVLDPAMGKGVVPVRKWLEMAGVTDGFNEVDLYDAKPLSADQGPLGPNETRLLITDPRAVSPPWLDSAFPASFEEASTLVQSWHERTREYSIEATERQQFRDWHAALPDDARGRFNTLNDTMTDASRRDFHDWFRSLSQQERADLAGKLGNADTTVADLVPNWDDRVNSARNQLGKLPEDAYTTAKSAADLIVMMHHDLTQVDDARKALLDKITDMVAYRHHKEGFDKAWELSQRLATEHGTGPRAGDAMNLDTTDWFTGLDTTLAPIPVTGDTAATAPALPWDDTDPTDLSWLNFDPNDLTGLTIDPAFLDGFTLDPNDPSGLTVDPNTLGGTTFDPNDSSGLTVDPNALGGSAFASNDSSGLTVDPAALGGTTFDPNNPGGAMVDPAALGGSTLASNGGFTVDPSVLGGSTFASNGGFTVDPSVPGGTAFASNDSGGFTVDPNLSGGTAFDPNALGGSTFDPNFLTGSTFDPNDPGGFAIDPNTRGGTTFDPIAFDPNAMGEFAGPNLFGPGADPFTVPGFDNPATTSDSTADTGPGKRNRDAFQADGGPVTGIQPRPAPPAPGSLDPGATGQPGPGSTDRIGGAFEPQDTGAPHENDTTHTPAESGPRKRSRDDFEADGPSTTYEPPATRPVSEQLVPPSPADVDALRAVVPAGARFTDPAAFAALVNGSRTELGRDVNCVDAALAFHETWHGTPRVAGSAPGGPASGATAAAEELGYAPELVGRGADGVAEVIERVRRGGHGSDALVFGFPRTGRGHAWNVVNHHGVLSIVDSQAGTVRPAEPGALPGLDRVYAIPLNADNEFIAGTGAPPPAAPSGTDPYAVAEHERAVRVHEMRTAAAAGEEIPVPETGSGRLVPSLGGLRLVGTTVTAALAAELATMTGRDVIALVIGPDAEEPEPLRFTPTGRPLPV